MVKEGNAAGLHINRGVLLSQRGCLKFIRQPLFHTCSKSLSVYLPYKVYDCALLKICFDGKGELVDKNTFESRYIILFVKQQHRLFVIYGIYRTERQRAIASRYQYRIAYYTCCALVAIVKWLYIRNQQQNEQRLVENALS